MLDEALRGLARSADPNLLVGFENADDAAVYQLTPELALVQTADFFTPIVDDPFAFGQIAAANALSDIYAMGGRPVTALSLVAFPANAGSQLLAAILAGGQSKLEEAGCALAGGHSVRDEELKFGFAVSGIIHPAKIWRNGGARVGDVLVLTKPLGTGVIGTAVKQQRARPEHERAAAENMARLNRLAAETLGAFHPHAVTDVTGFGLLGHARGMARASRDGTGLAPELQLRAGALPLLPGAEDYALGFQPQGLRDNRAFAGPAVEFAPEVSAARQALMFDPQTAGGLLIAMDPAEARTFIARMSEQGWPVAEIGAVGSGRPEASPVCIRVIA